MKSIQQDNIKAKLMALHADAENDDKRIEKVPPGHSSAGRPPSDYEYAYLPITRDQGLSLRSLILESKSKRIVEFGTSFGISTIYFADAVQQTGGKVITTELLKSKADIARQNLIEIDLEKFVDIRVGDAMETLQDLTENIDFLFLDGWKDLYLPLFQMLEPLFTDTTLIYADNMDMDSTSIYRENVLNNKDYISKLVHEGKGMISRKK